MRSYKVYFWKGNCLDASWLLADTRAIAEAKVALLRREGAVTVVVLGPDWQVADSWSEGEGVSLDAVLGRGRHGTPTDDGPRAA